MQTYVLCEDLERKEKGREKKSFISQTFVFLSES